MRHMDEKPDPQTYSELVACFRQTMANMEVWLQYGSTTNYETEPSHGGDVSSGRPSGDENPPHLFWQERWKEAGNRRKVWEEAWEELLSLSQRKVVEYKEETRAERDARILKEGEGWSVKDIEYHFKLPARTIRAIRTQAGMTPETGMPTSVSRMKKEMDKPEWVRELAAKGLTERQISMITEVPKTTVRNITKENA